MRKVIIIGGSKGIGNALLLELLNNYEVINLSRTAPEITHPNLVNYSLDVLTDELPSVEELDSLIYCPGSINLKPFGSLKQSDFQSDFEINVLGAVKVIQAYLPALRKGTDPSIVLFSSVATKLGMPYHASVAVAKSGVEGLVKSLGAEFASVIRVNGIAPTITDTTLAAGILRNDRMKENMIERHPMKGYLQAEEVAGMAAFLISEKAKSISGQIFEMDYGLVQFKL